MTLTEALKGKAGIADRLCGDQGGDELPSTKRLKLSSDLKSYYGCLV